MHSKNPRQSTFISDQVTIHMVALHREKCQGKILMHYTGLTGQLSTINVDLGYYMGFTL